jgi:hypothetical protein
LEKRIGAMARLVQVPFTQGGVRWIPHRPTTLMSTLNRLRQLAWTALVLAPGLVGTGCTPVANGAGTRQAGPAELPATPRRTAAVTPSATTPAAEDAAGEGWPWPFGEEDDPWRELDELEDEFEGGGWTFWPSS